MAFGLLCEMFIILSLCKKATERFARHKAIAKKSTKPSLKRLGFYTSNAVFFVKKMRKNPYLKCEKKHFKQGFSPCP